MTNRTRADVLLLAGFCAFLFFYGLNHFGLIGADEPRYAQVAHEMLERHDWITPTLGGQPWLEKPPLYYWQAAIAYSIFGVSDWAARLPSAIDATLLVLAIYFFLRRFRSGFELDGALIAASCAGIIGYSRAASTDMPLCATFGIGMIAWCAWRESGKRSYLAAFYVFIALATLAKGPVAPLLAALIIVLYATTAREPRSIRETVWWPGILVFLAVALPWYAAVQSHNPQFLHEFFLEQNLARFSKNLYHHVEPFWYYLPVTALAVVPWTIFLLLAFVHSIQNRFKRISKTTSEPAPLHLGIFAGCWLAVPVIFFSVSQSKLPGYILPAIPAASLLLVEYLYFHLKNPSDERVPTWLAILHGLLASASIVPALLIAYLLTQRRLPGGQPMFVALAVAFVLCAAIALTLVRKSGLRMLRFVTLIPVVLTLAAALKFGAQDLDQVLSARPVARELAQMEMRPMPLAVYHVRRELEYGLTFYRNHLTLNYDWGAVPQQEHLLVAPEGSQVEIGKLVPGRRVSYLGHYAAQHIDYFWVAAAN
ncbi:MAG TPA: glycosyltransferase family 39 protein [Candidatus Sulfotelmatobacter sp.]|jgi:4-amino-4-deoxy-L-arabinose transferase-like glycosyltransferase